jgi:glucose/arabinose dehydrogenase
MSPCSPRPRTALLLLSLAWACAACSNGQAPAQPGTPEGSQEGTGFGNNVLRPERQDFRPELLQQLTLAPGFEISVFAQGLEAPRMMAVAPSGAVYVTRPKKADVLMLEDTDGDGRAETPRAVLSGLKDVHGIALHQGLAYVATPTEVYVAEVRGDGSWGAPRVLVAGLPDGGQHPNRTLAVGPDGKLYISVGSSCNACAETNAEHAAMLRVNLDGSGREIFARGLRNTIGFGWHPQTGELWGMDHGSDHRGDDIPPEELNRLAQGRDYGWPYVYGQQQLDPVIDEPKDMSKAEYAAKTEPAVLTYQAHSAPIGMVFHTGEQLPAEYRGDAFIAMRGSWNRKPATGYKLVRLDFVDGQPRGFEDLVSGFLMDEGRAHFGRLAGVAQARDGALLLGDDTNGVIYRVTYKR